jgi:hypothetical protein
LLDAERSQGELRRVATSQELGATLVDGALGHAMWRKPRQGLNHALMIFDQQTDALGRNRQRE